MSKKKPLISIEEYTTEREIAEMQLERLKQLSRERLLSYEEVKIYDLLTKNLLLSKGDATAIVTSSSKADQKAIEDAETSELIQIATSVTEADVKKVLNFVEEAKDGGSESTDN
jgi:hypothetical protein